MQSWGTLRFDDHRGVKPGDVSFVGGSLSARLTRSKTLGSDVEWDLAKYSSMDAASLKEGNGYKEDGGYCVRLRILIGIIYFRLRQPIATGAFLPSQGMIPHTRVSTSFWTPHSASAFLPSCTKALGVPKEERDYLGGWSARGSDISAQDITFLGRLPHDTRDRLFLVSVLGAAFCHQSPNLMACASCAARKGPYGFMSPAELTRLRLQSRRERSERNRNLA